MARLLVLATPIVANVEPSLRRETIAPSDVIRLNIAGVDPDLVAPIKLNCPFKASSVEPAIPLSSVVLTAKFPGYHLIVLPLYN